MAEVVWIDVILPRMLAASISWSLLSYAVQIEA
jgi:hypothetical protein